MICSRPSSVSTTVLNVPSRIAYSAVKGSPGQNKLPRFLTRLRLLATSSSCRISSGSRASGEHNSRMLEEAQCGLSSQNATTFGDSTDGVVWRRARSDMLIVGHSHERRCSLNPTPRSRREIGAANCRANGGQKVYVRLNTTIHGGYRMSVTRHT